MKTLASTKTTVAPPSNIQVFTPAIEAVLLYRYYRDNAEAIMSLHPKCSYWGVQ